jgi:hypothetical protein
VYLAYYLHWPLREILDLEHPVRARVIEEVGRIHTLGDPAGPAPNFPT